MQMKVDGNSPGGLYGRVPGEQTTGPVDAPTTTSAGALSGDTRSTGAAKTGAGQPKGTSTPDLGAQKAEKSDLGEVTAKMLSSQPGAFSVQQLFVELLDVGKTLKTAARLDREAKLNRVQAEAKAAADDMRSAAWLSLAATLVTSTAQIAGAAYSLKGATASQKAFEAKFKEIGGAGGDATATFKAAEMARQAAQLSMAPYQFRATLAGEGGKMVGGVPQLVAQYLEASKSDHQAESAREQAKADNEGDYKQAAEKLIASVLDKMSEMQRAQAQAMSSIARMG